VLSSVATGGDVMDKRPPPAAGWLWWIAKRAGLGLALAGLGMAVVHGLNTWLAPEGPLIDLSQRTGATSAAGPRAAGHDHLQFAVATMVSAEATFSTYRQLVQRICRDVGRKEAFVIRPSYAHVRQELEQGNVHVALVCTGTYVHALAGGRIKLLVQPEFEEGREYRSLLIVPAQSRATNWEDLRGAVMAYTDRESNTGCLVPSATLAERGHRLESFFRKVVFTGSHDRSIQAVARGVVDGAAVDALLWESNVRHDPSLADRVKVIWQSEVFGPPPVVVPAGLEAGLERALREAFLTLDQDDEGRAILSDIGIRRFVAARPEDYRTAAELHTRVQALGGVRWP
jgi:phosphonate transport system substrate-binding protein